MLQLVGAHRLVALHRHLCCANTEDVGRSRLTEDVEPLRSGERLLLRGRHLAMRDLANGLLGSSVSDRSKLTEQMERTKKPR